MHSLNLYSPTIPKNILCLFLQDFVKLNITQLLISLTVWFSQSEVVLHSNTTESWKIQKTEITWFYWKCHVAFRCLLPFFFFEFLLTCTNSQSSHQVSFSLTADHNFDNGYVWKQPLSWKKKKILCRVLVRETLVKYENVHWLSWINCIYVKNICAESIIGQFIDIKLKQNHQVLYLSSKIPLFTVYHST